MQNTSAKKFQLPFHVVKRMDISKKKVWAIRILSFVIAFLMAAIFTTILKSGTFGTFFVYMGQGVFDVNDPEVLTLFLENASILLIISLALLPAFKMKFWNIGAEGQVMVGCLITAVITSYCPSSMNSGLVIILAILASVLAGIIWAVIPAIFKAFFNTNETLFTLMMNYIAIGITEATILACNRGESGKWGIISTHQLPNIGIKYIFSIIVVVVVAVLMWFYMNKSKSGYELSVVGESQNTARYVGINVKKVIIRTMILSGALCGLAGFLIVAGNQHTLNSSLVNGRGFTAIFITWLGHFDIPQIALFSLLSAFFTRGAFNTASMIGVSTNFYSGMITGLFFLVVIASEFFTNYKVMGLLGNRFKKRKKKNHKELKEEN